DAVIGFEFSGRLSNGRRVMGMRMGGCVTTEIIVPDFFLWDVPDEMTLLEASTIPAAYGTKFVVGSVVMWYTACGALSWASSETGGFTLLGLLVRKPSWRWRRTGAARGQAGRARGPRVGVLDSAPYRNLRAHDQDVDGGTPTFASEMVANK
ncbi:Uncharacterized protein GBIM_21042, partial [Gryllus bimaculatus]